MCDGGCKSQIWERRWKMTTMMICLPYWKILFASFLCALWDDIGCVYFTEIPSVICLCYHYHSPLSWALGEFMGGEGRGIGVFWREKKSVSGRHTRYKVIICVKESSNRIIEKVIGYTSYVIFVSSWTSVPPLLCRMQLCRHQLRDCQ